jgi:hypothetical protein
MERGEISRGAPNNSVTLSQEQPGRYRLTTSKQTSIFAAVPFKTLRHCTVALHHLNGYALFQGERIALTDRFIYIADSNAISWRPDESGQDVSEVVSQLLRRYKLVGSVYYKKHVYLTMEDRDL